MTPEEAAHLQTAFHEDRRDWAEAIGRPFPQRRSSKRKPEPAVIDGEDPERGYEPGNIAVISHKANTIKSNASVAELRAVLAYLETADDRQAPSRHPPE